MDAEFYNFADDLQFLVLEVLQPRIHHVRHYLRHFKKFLRPLYQASSVLAVGRSAAY
uniref:Uncharacterized protein n=1 Tax=Rhizophora mucronata TaxID=61149 RepID=A0A2P2QMD5_RHIMU